MHSMKKATHKCCQINFAIYLLRSLTGCRVRESEREGLRERRERGRYLASADQARGLGAALAIGEVRIKSILFHWQQIGNK